MTIKVTLNKICYILVRIAISIVNMVQHVALTQGVVNPNDVLHLHIFITSIPFRSLFLCGYHTF